MRPTHDQYMMRIAFTVAERATCPRRAVGAVYELDGRIVATGYNGAPPNMLHCTEGGCLLEADHCVRTVHAEVNGIAQAARQGISLYGSTCYCTLRPCWRCVQTMVSVGVQKIVYAENYGTPWPIYVPVYTEHQPNDDGTARLTVVRAYYEMLEELALTKAALEDSNAALTALKSAG